MATADDGKGNVNNKVDVPSFAAPAQSLATGPIANMPRSTRQIPNAAAGERVYDDMRFARMKLNRVHEHANRLDASSFLDQPADDILVVTR